MITPPSKLHWIAGTLALALGLLAALTSVMIIRSRSEVAQLKAQAAAAREELDAVTRIPAGNTAKSDPADSETSHAPQSCSN
ncbi:MAG: hypothetical protein ACKV19_06940 [Verrucomicrobiales bacterium]